MLATLQALPAAQVAGEAGFDVQYLRRRSESRGCATYPAVDLEFAVFRGSIAAWPTRGDYNEQRDDLICCQL
jgi:hypothetical protein